MIWIIVDDQRNAEFVRPVHEQVSVGAQYRCEWLDAYAGDRLLPDQRIVRWRELASAVIVAHSTHSWRFGKNPPAKSG